MAGETVGEGGRVRRPSSRAAQQSLQTDLVAVIVASYACFLRCAVSAIALHSKERGEAGGEGMVGGTKTKLNPFWCFGKVEPT